jgi:hypothetical protein
VEDGIFLGWTALNNLISGTNYEPIRHNDHNLTTELGYDILDSEISHNHASATRLEELQQRPEHRTYKPTKPCAGCGDEMSPHGREDCPNRGKRCYNCNKIGHVWEVCRQRPATIRNDYQRDTIRKRMLTNLTYQLQNPIWKNENDQRLVDLTHQLRDAIWKAKGTTDHPDDRSPNKRPEDVDPQLHNASDTPDPNNCAEDTVRTENQQGDTSEIRPMKCDIPACGVTYSNNLLPDNFLIPFQYGFHREVVRGANGKTLRVYYHTENGISLGSKKDVDPYIEKTQGITRDDFDFSGAVLPIEDPTKKYQSVRLDQRTLPNN